MYHRKIQDQVGSVKTGTWHQGNETTAINSMVQNGCEVSGIVSESTLLEGAKVESGAQVSNCLIGGRSNYSFRCNIEQCGCWSWHGSSIRTYSE